VCLSFDEATKLFNFYLLARIQKNLQQKFHIFISAYEKLVFIHVDYTSSTNLITALP
jgi:hypothetical protein